MAFSDLVVYNLATSSFEEDEVRGTSHFPFVYVNDCHSNTRLHHGDGYAERKRGRRKAVMA